jgi:hypothetical protein
MDGEISADDLCGVYPENSIRLPLSWLLIISDEESDGLWESKWML